METFANEIVEYIFGKKRIHYVIIHNQYRCEFKEQRFLIESNRQGLITIINESQNKIIKDVYPQDLSRIMEEMTMRKYTKLELLLFYGILGGVGYYLFRSRIFAHILKLKC